MGPSHAGRGGFEFLLSTDRAKASPGIDEAKRLTAAVTFISGPVVIAALEASAWLTLTLIPVLSLEHLEDAAEDAAGQ